MIGRLLDKYVIDYEFGASNDFLACAIIRIKHYFYTIRRGSMEGSLRRSGRRRRKVHFRLTTTGRSGHRENHVRNCP